MNFFAELKRGNFMSIAGCRTLRFWNESNCVSGYGV